MHKKYSYVGPKNITYAENLSIQRVCVQSSKSILKWISETNQELDSTSSVTSTYIVDTEENLWITDRHCEHVWCACGREVLAAGEISFALEYDDIEVLYISNQSTGYCPEPSSWEVVHSALDRVQISHPTAFSLELIFRLCLPCKQINIVKDDIFECAICNKKLSSEWNF